MGKQSGFPEGELSELKDEAQTSLDEERVCRVPGRRRSVPKADTARERAAFVVLRDGAPCWSPLLDPVPTQAQHGVNAHFTAEVGTA